MDRSKNESSDSRRQTHLTQKNFIEIEVSGRDPVRRQSAEGGLQFRRGMQTMNAVAMGRWSRDKEKENE